MLHMVFYNNILEFGHFIHTVLCSGHGTNIKTLFGKTEMYSFINL